MSEYKKDGTISSLFSGLAGNRKTSKKLWLPDGRYGYAVYRLVARERKDSAWDVLGIWRLDVCREGGHSSWDTPPKMVCSGLSKEAAVAVLAEHNKKFTQLGDALWKRVQVPEDVVMENYHKEILAAVGIIDAAPVANAIAPDVAVKEQKPSAVLKRDIQVRKPITFNKRD